jgi:plasmid stability protein
MKRTTVRFDEDVLRRLKQKAASEDRTLQDVANELLRQILDHDQQPIPFKLRFPTWKARELPGVDICDRKSLFDIMDGI